MRQISAVFLLAVILSCSEPSSSINMDDEKQVRNALVGEWESTYLETTAGRTKVPNEIVTVIAYEANGTYVSRTKGGVIANTGNWSYDPKSHRLNNREKELSYYQRAISLTEKELILTNYTFSNDQIVDSTIETYRKR